MTTPVSALYSLLSELEKPGIYLRRIRAHYTVGSVIAPIGVVEHAIKMGYVRPAGADMWRLSPDGVAVLAAWRDTLEC